MNSDYGMGDPRVCQSEEYQMYLRYPEGHVEKTQRDKWARRSARRIPANPHG